MTPFSLSSSYVDDYIVSHNSSFPISVQEAHKSLQNKTCEGNDYLGWIDPPVTIQKSITDIQATAARLRVISDVWIA